MDEELKGDKIERVLRIYAKLMEGRIINKTEEAKLYSVLLFPAFLVGLVCIGLLSVATLILAITGVAVLIGEAVKA